MISKQRIYEILDGAVRDRASKICEISIIAVVVVNVFAVILDSVPEIHSEYKNFFQNLELISVIKSTAGQQHCCPSYDAPNHLLDILYYAPPAAAHPSVRGSTHTREVASQERSAWKLSISF